MQSLHRLFGLAAGIGLCCVAPCHAGIIVTPEAAGVQATTVVIPAAGTMTTETFDGVATGNYPMLSSPIGTYTSPGRGMLITTADLFGGAFGSQYPDLDTNGGAGGVGGSTVAELDFGGERDYFGFWWSAMDATDLVQFFLDGSLVESYTRADIAPALGSAYLGNPNTGENAGEYYAFLNFQGFGGTTFDQIVFTETDNSGNGFETDNHTVFGDVLQETPVPEPATVVLFALGGVGLIAARRRRVGKALN